MRDDSIEICALTCCEQQRAMMVQMYSAFQSIRVRYGLGLKWYGVLGGE